MCDSSDFYGEGGYTPFYMFRGHCPLAPLSTPLLKIKKIFFDQQEK